MQNESVWNLVVEIYQYTKELLLIGEEVDEDFRSVLDAKLEITHAYDHFMRVKSAQLSMPNPSLSLDDVHPVLLPQPIQKEISALIEAEMENSNDNKDNRLARYAAKNLDKMLGHQYRAFFDAADELAIRLRRKLSKLVEPFDSETLTTGWEDYYRHVRCELERMNREIAGIRMGKDVGTDP